MDVWFIRNALYISLSTRVHTLLPILRLQIVQRSTTPSGQGTSWLVVFTSRLGRQPMLSVLPGASSTLSPGAIAGVESVTVGAFPVLNSASKGSLVVNASPASSSSSGVISAVIPGLRRGSFYTARVSAWNGVGGAYGPPRVSSSPPCVRVVPRPAALRSLAVEPLSECAFNVSWSPPSNLGECRALSLSLSLSLSPTRLEDWQVLYFYSLRMPCILFRIRPSVRLCKYTHQPFIRFIRLSLPFLLPTYIHALQARAR